MDDVTRKEREEQRSREAQARLVRVFGDLGNAAAYVARAAASANGWDGAMLTHYAEQADRDVTAVRDYILGSSAKAPEGLLEYAKAETCRDAWTELAGDFRVQLERLTLAILAAVVVRVPLLAEIGADDERLVA